MSTAMDARSRYLDAYDRQLRASETAGANAVTRLGPLLLVTWPAGRGFVTYQDLGGANPSTLATWIGQTLAHFRGDPAIRQVEWKTRGHDVAPGLHEALIERGFAPEEPESIMIGEAALLAVDVALPDGVSVRRITDRPDIQAMCEMQAGIFGDPISDDIADSVLARLATADGLELWVAEAGGQVVSAGRLDPVAGTEFAGIWGGATRPEWRGRGIYRALTAARARSAIAIGKRLIHSDSTEFSRPILERAGLMKVSTTTPYVWHA
ncbi:MAG TPA: GNAT family N-acetyltransferase [Micromonosporaceae bacterium]|nr:GNAT family N-acetyltransferase [Micromonosporaceae bacterium]